MNKLVPFKVTSLIKCLATKVARIRNFSSMNIYGYIKCTILIKSLATNVALMKNLFSINSMTTHMILQVIDLCECLATNRNRDSSMLLAVQ